jgi:hypothetical protein
MAYKSVQTIHARVWESMERVRALSTASRVSTARVASVQTTNNLGNPALTHMSAVVSGCVCLTIQGVIWGCVSAISVLNPAIIIPGREYITKLAAIQVNIY